MPDVWYWTPNGISETLEFRTDIRISRTVEIRDGFKDATQYLNYSHTVSPPVAEEMIQLVRSNATGAFTVPVWPLATFFSSGEFASASTTIFVDDEAAYFVGQKVYIGHGSGPDTWDEVTVVSVAEQELTFTPGLSQTYTASRAMKVAVAPMVDSILPNGLSFSSRFAVKDLNAAFLSLQPQDLAQNPFSTFEGLPLLTEGGVPFAPLSGRVGQASQLVTSGFGFYEMVEVEDFQRRYGTASFHDDTWSDRFAMRRFMHFMRGRDGEAWFPTGQRDLTLVNNIISTAFTVTVRPIAPASEMIGKSILFREGDLRVAREITGATDTSPTVQTLAISPTGENFTTRAGVSLLHKCRFDTDVFDLQYGFTPHGLVSRFSAPVIEVP